MAKQEADDLGPEARSRVVVGIDVGGTKTALLVTDVASGEDRAEATFATEVGAGPAAMIEQIAAATETAIAGLARPSTLGAVGLAMPGLVGVRHGRVIAAGNLKGWIDIPGRDLLSRRLGVPVSVDQDGAAPLHGAVFGALWQLDPELAPREELR